MLGRSAVRLLGSWRAASVNARSMKSDWVAVNGMLGSPYTRNEQSCIRSLSCHTKITYFYTYSINIHETI